MRPIAAASPGGGQDRQLAATSPRQPAYHAMPPLPAAFQPIWEVYLRDSRLGQHLAAPQPPGDPAVGRQALFWYQAFSSGALAALELDLSSLSQSRCLAITMSQLASVYSRVLVDGGGRSLQSLEAELATCFRRNPGSFLGELECGLHAALLSKEQSSSGMQDHGSDTRKPFVVGVTDVTFQKPFDCIRSDIIGNYVGIRGTVIRAGNVAPELTALSFTCLSCSSKFMVSTVDGRFQYPTACSRKCKFARFAVNRDECEAVDWQRVRLQEEYADVATGDQAQRRMPQSVDCNVRHGLVGACLPGDVVTLFGIVRATPTDNNTSKGAAGKGWKSQGLFALYLDVKAVVSSKHRSSGNPDTNSNDTEDVTPLQIEFIREIYHEAERLPLLVASFCPHIYGQPLVKAALLLALLGGVPVRTSASPGSRTRRRGDIHVLLLGDPGLGKSELLRALSKLSPRGVYVCGNSSSAAGLTASVVRDSTGEFALEAGALILADKGVCCIDEFDKMGAEQQAFLEAMEQQTVSIAKAGIVCTIPARTSVIAAANPSKGSWDMSMTFAQNLKGVMSEALMSRFDVLMLMRDDRTASDDLALSRHIVQNRFSRNHGEAAHRPAPSSSDGADWAMSAAEGRGGLLERCSAKAGTKAVLPTELLIAYIKYAKRYVEPELSKGAKEMIKQFYLERRKAQHASSGELPITPRQLEAVIRLSQARAKAELRQVVLRKDVSDVIEILNYGLRDAVIAELPELPQRKGKSTLSVVVERIRQAVERRSRGSGALVFKEQELRKFAGDGVPDQLFDKAMHRLNIQESVLLNQGGGFVYSK
eukprot:TRINITY_DN13231_c0_g2_i1.p1 TRINITY_DN13231_c0_g2~~TRINITY_DN13231_c0_g2_i1.p1  ORF type:complete len:819 (-),score=149.19 TRINITY_DN13231_c0_g2_i1:231-2687(-)